jgi:UDP-MurNAc hydroxylase
MRMEWVNHASFIIRSGSVSLLCDAWLEGTAFNQGWSLLSPTKLSYEDFASITHIWFSHEYADHFNPPNLRNIREDYRRRIKVLFHYTKDKRVVNLCKALGFDTQELPEWETVEIAPDFKMISGMQGLIDSWSAIFAEGKTLLNMNDCVFDRQRDLEKVKQSVGKTDVLMSQFSYATWVGNPDDRVTHKKHADHKLAEMSRQIQVFQPGQFIPFASYVFFSHAENSYMNMSSNRIGNVFHYLTRELNIPTLVLYPGDHWEVGTPYDSTEAIRRYDADLHRALESEPTRTKSVSLDQLQEAAHALVLKFSARNNQLLLNALPPAVIYLSDLDIHLALSFRTGIKAVEECQPDIILSSDSLLNCLTTDWGGETLVINGRFQVPPGGRPRRFFWIFRVPRHNSIGTHLDLRFLGRQAVERVRSAGVGQ